MKDLVQELREVDSRNICDLLHEIRGEFDCGEYYDCKECVMASFNVIADRIEAEYDPKPEPETVEKVALDMLKAFDEAAKRCNGGKRLTYVHPDRPKWYRKRLEALGVKVDG